MAMTMWSEPVASLLLDELMDGLIDLANELRLRVMDVPNPLYESEGGTCLHSPENGCAWHCVRRHDFTEEFTDDGNAIRQKIRERIGPALWAIIGGDGADVTRIDRIAIQIAQPDTARRGVELNEGVMDIAAITGDELRKALAELEKAEAAGFTASQAVFFLKPKNSVWGDGAFSDICEKAHPTDGSLNWGRDNFLTERGLTFRDGKLIEAPHEYRECKDPECEIEYRHCDRCGSKNPESCVKGQSV